jgi:hypothetical protein
VKNEKGGNAFGATYKQQPLSRASTIIIACQLLGVKGLTAQGGPTFGRLDVTRRGAIVGPMEATKRTTVYFDPEIHRALRLKATERSVSDLVNEAVRLTLSEDAEDLQVFEQRRSGPLLSFGDAIKGLKRRGRL